MGLMLLFAKMTTAAIGYRAAARALEVVSPVLPGGAFPTANGGQSWLLRLGLHELTRAKEPADDWVWIFDHTIQTGYGKCFIVVGVRLSVWESKRAAALAADPNAPFALTREDLSVWALERVDSSCGEAVRGQLEQLSEATGITPRELLSDQGADLRGGGALFCEGRSTVAVYDIAHAVANALKRQLHKDAAWQEFLADANHCKTQIRQTPYAFLMPPDLKGKSRWMNLEPLISWSRRVRRFLDDPRTGLAAAEAPDNLEALEAKIGWLRKHAESIAVWGKMLEASAVILKYIRAHGYHRRAPDDLERLLVDFPDGASRAVVDEVLPFVRAQSARAGEGRLIGSSEVLESLIGTGKQLQGRNKHGYTKTVLGMAAAVMNLTPDIVETALAAVKVRDVHEWTRKKLGLGLQSQRQRALPLLSVGTKPG